MTGGAHQTAFNGTPDGSWFRLPGGPLRAVASQPARTACGQGLQNPRHDRSGLLAAARAYAERLGWAVLPLAGKVPAIRGGRGVYDATCDPETIVRWWREHADANIGVACGAVSSIVVVDVDGETGRATFTKLQDVHGTLPSTPRQVTGSGGLHSVFAYDAARPIGNRVRVLPGIDTRSDGGSIVVSPSIHPSGRQYRWDPELHPLIVRPAPMPIWFADLLAPRGEPSPVGNARPVIEEDVGWGPEAAVLGHRAPACLRGDRGGSGRPAGRLAESRGVLDGPADRRRSHAASARDRLPHLRRPADDQRARPTSWREREIQQKVVRAICEGELYPREVA